MAKSDAGFTLLEVTLTLAITGALFLVIFAGQSKQRSNANFTASVDQIVASISNSRNQAISGVSVRGHGTGIAPTNCVAAFGSSVAYFAGTQWRSVPSGSVSLMSQITVARASLGGGATQVCGDNTQTVNINTPVPVRVTALGSNLGAQIVFIRKIGSDGYYPCFFNSGTVSVGNSFRDGNSCTGGNVTAMTLVVSDTDSHRVNLIIDPATGLAHR